MDLILPPPEIKVLRASLERQGLTLIRMPGTIPTWAALGLRPAQILSYRQGRWAASSDELQALVERALK